MLGLRWTPARSLQLRMLAAGLRSATPVMPARLRCVGPDYLRWRRDAIAAGEVAAPERLIAGGGAAAV